MTEYFIWDVNRTILGTGLISLRWYSLLFMTGVGTAYIWVTHMAKAENIGLEGLEDLFFYVLITTIAGARLGHCLFYDPVYYLSNPLQILKIWQGGLASHGGYLGMVLGIFIFRRQNKTIPLLWLLDRLAMAGLLTGAFIRVGNFFNSEILGKPAAIPWAVIFKQVDEIPRHPVQLYEALGYLAVSLGLYGVYRACGRRPLEGRLLGLAMAGGFGFRFIIEFFKENQAGFESGLVLNLGQWLSIPFIALGVLFASGLHHRLGGKK